MQITVEFFVNFFANKKNEKYAVNLTKNSEKKYANFISNIE